MQSDDGSNNIGHVKILVPHHVSATPPEDDSTLFLRVFQSHGVAWRGLYPLLIEAPPRKCRRLLRLLFQSSKPSTLRSMHATKQNHSKRGSENDDKKVEEDLLHSFYERTIRLRHVPNVTIVLVPPTIPQLDSTFASLVIRTERLLLRLQTLTAWWATLGGGYFFCRRLRRSLQLARQQCYLALQMGNISMARQCSVNEAYNLIYAGKFGAAKQVLSELEESIRASKDPDEGSVTLRQCQAARLLAKRLKKLTRRGLKGYHTMERGEKHTIDDYQRIRIVED